MRTAWSTFPIEVGGGLITNLSSLQQGVRATGSATILNNFEPSVEGGYKKILGYTKWSEYKVPGDTLVTGVIATDFRNAIAVSGGKYYTSTDKADWVERLDLSSDSTGKIRHDTYNFDGTMKVVMLDGVHKPIFYNSVTHAIAEDTSAPSEVEGAHRVIEYKKHLFFAKGPLVTFTAYFTDNNYAPGAGAGTINVGDRVTGFAVFREQLIIFTENSIFRLMGNTSSDFILQPITRKTGCICGDTIQEVGGDILYLGPDGVRFLSATERNEDFALQRASEAIQDKITTILDGQPLCGYASCTIKRKSQYRIFRWNPVVSRELSEGYLATRFIDQEAAGIQWASIFGIKPYVIDSKQHREVETILFSTTEQVGGSYIYEMEQGNSFDGAVIPCRYKTPDFPISDPRVRKTFYKITTYLDAQGPLRLVCQPRLDEEEPNTIQPPEIIITSTSGEAYLYGAPSSVYNTSTYGGSFEVSYLKNTIGSAFTIALEYIEESTNPPFTIDTALIEYRQNDRK